MFALVSALEVVNSLFLVVAGSELFLLRGRGGGWPVLPPGLKRRVAVGLCALALLNLAVRLPLWLDYHYTHGSFFLHRLASWSIEWVVAPAVALSHLAGSSGAVSALLWTLVWAFVRARWGLSWPALLCKHVPPPACLRERVFESEVVPGLWRGGGAFPGAVAWGRLLACGVVLLTAVLFRLAGMDDYLHHTESLRVVGIALLFVVLNILDVRRHDPDILPADYVRALARAIAYAIPAFPVAAVVISTAFLVLVSLFELVHVDPHRLSSAIYYGTLYGPLYVIYWKIKVDLVGGGSTVLPSMVGSGGEGAAVSNTEAVRRARMSAMG